MFDPPFPIPARIRALPRDERGYPVPWFVANVGGRFDAGTIGPAVDFRVMDNSKRKRAVRDRLCWVCGQQLGRASVYVVGPMCVVNRTSAEPPSHTECAEFSVRACPFLSLPAAKRREHGLPENVYVDGSMIARNPGVIVLWATRRNVETFGDGRGGFLFHLPDPTDVSFWREGRAATRAEVVESMETGIPTLRAMAEKEGPRAVFELGKQVGRAWLLLPAGEDAAP